MNPDEFTPLIENDEVEIAVFRPTKRYGILLAGVFVVGTMCGSGVLAIPQAIVDAGWTGIPLLVICGCISAFTGTLLGKSLTLLRHRYPEEFVLQRCNDPYPKIAHRAGGRIWEYATRFCIDMTLFGGAVVFLLLIADNITNLMHSIGGVTFYSCYMLMIVFVVLTPLTWLGTPKDFWQAAVVAAVTTSIGALLIVAGVVKDAPEHKDHQQANISAASFFTSFGTILYSFGGASCFPTVQVDMADPSKFPVAVVIGIIVVLCLYLPAGISGFVVFGSDMKPNVLAALSDGGISYAINILITSHLLMAFVIITNPVTQEIEGFFKIPDKFTWKRVMIRTLYTAAILFFALSIPHFSVILTLVGGSAIACTNFIFPPLFYYLLSRQKKPEDAYGNMPEKLPNATINHHAPYHWETLDLSITLKVILLVIMLVGISGGFSSTYFAIASLANGKSGFTVPCYVNASVG